MTPFNHVSQPNEIYELIYEKNWCGKEDNETKSDNNIIPKN